MKLLRKDTDYALAALVYLVRYGQKQRISAAELADALSLPHGFLRKILKTLSGEGIVSSAMGKGGGFVMACDPDKLSVMVVLKVVQGPIHGTECAVDKDVCPHTRACRVRRAMSSVEKALEAELRGITISDLANK
jgi:Rrf2 family iron-sulfur cluster assembly transcriptional regulator